MVTKEHLKKYRESKRIIKYCEQKIAEGDTSGDLLVVRDHHARFISRIESAVADLTDPTEQLLIRLRYFDGYSWTKIGYALHYSKSSLQRIHDKALEHLAKSRVRIEEVTA